MVIIVTSDQHLGYAKSNSDDFKNFLDYISSRNDITDFVILGDFIDMWRRDVSGLFLEHHEILHKVLDLKSKMKVYCVAGNHDFHLLKLINHNYPLEFTKDLTITSDKVTYTFKHGWEFDLAQKEPIMELLCYNISDDSGQLRSDFWDVFTKTFGKDILDSLKDLFDHHIDRDNYLKTLQTPPNERLQQDITDLEKRVCSSVKDGEILIFGHTHRPFVNTNENVVNTGSWVSDATITNTYVELDGNTIHLMQYGGKEITDREICSSN